MANPDDTYPSFPKGSSGTTPMFPQAGGLYAPPTADTIAQRKAAALKVPINLIGLPRYQGYGPDRPGDESQAASYPAPVAPTMGPLMSPEPTPPAMLPFNPRGAGTGAPAGPALGSAENPYSAGPDWGYRNKIAAGGKPGETAVVDYGRGFDSGSGGTTRVQATADKSGRFNQFGDAPAPNVFKGGGYAVGPGGYPLNPGDVPAAPAGPAPASAGGAYGGGSDPYGIRANLASTQARYNDAQSRAGGSILDAIHATRYQKDLNNLQERGIQAGQLGVAQGHLGVAQGQLGINYGQLGVNQQQLGIHSRIAGVQEGQLNLERNKLATDPMRGMSREAWAQLVAGHPDIAAQFMAASRGESGAHFVPVPGGVTRVSAFDPSVQQFITSPLVTGGAVSPAAAVASTAGNYGPPPPAPVQPVLPEMYRSKWNTPEY